MKVWACVGEEWRKREKKSKEERVRLKRRLRRQSGNATKKKKNHYNNWSANKIYYFSITFELQCTAKDGSALELKSQKILHIASLMQSHFGYIGC